MLIPTFYQEIQKKIDRLGFSGHHDITSAPLSPSDEYHAPVPVHGESDWYQNFMFVGEDRLQRYADFVDMDTHPLTASALDVYGEESTQKDAWGNVVQVITNDQVIKDEINHLLFKCLNINHTLYSIVRETCKYGDKFQYLVMRKDRKGILFLKDMPVHSVWRLEWNGKLIAFVQQTPQGITPPLDPFSVVHWRISLNQEKYKPYGTSIFDPCRRHYRQMKLMEDAMVVYRITRAPERRVFFINCGRLNPAKAESYMRKIIHRFRKRSIINPSTGEIDWRCLPGNTRIPLLNGTNPTIKELAEQFPNGGFNVYSTNDDRMIVPGNALGAKKTGENKQLYKVTLDDGSSFEATANHPLRLMTGEYVCLSDAKPGMRLMPLYRKDSPIGRRQLKGYELAMHPATGEWEYTHKIVADSMIEYEHSKNVRVIHHADFNKRNNDPQNLVEMTRFDHTILHGNHGGEIFRRKWNEPEFRASKAADMSEMVKKNWKNPEYRAKMKELNSVVGKRLKNDHEKWSAFINGADQARKDNWNNPEYQKLVSDTARNTVAQFRKDPDFDKRRVQKVRESYSAGNWNNSEARQNACHENGLKTGSENMRLMNLFKGTVIAKVLYENWKKKTGSQDKFAFSRWWKEKGKLAYQEWKLTVKETEIVNGLVANHVIASIEPTICEDVYDLLVEGYHNFAITCENKGSHEQSCVFVHNSNPLAPDEDFYVPVRDGTDGTRIEQLAGAANLGEVDDVAWFKDQVLAYLKIPRVYLQQKDGGSAERRENLCLDGDTKIALLDGNSPTIRELAERGEDFWTYSIDKTGKIVPGHGHDARITRRNTEVLEVELDNGEKVIATPDHPFMMRDGTYQKAERLVPGDSLMPLYRRISGVDDDSLLKGYEQVYNPKSGKWPFTHRMVQESLFGSIPKDCVVHHEDFNKRNNSPTNLKVMDTQEHADFHIKLAKENITLDVISRRNESIRLFYQTDEGKRVMDSARLAGKENVKKWLDSEKHREFKRALRTEQYVPGDAFYDFQHSEKNREQGKIRGKKNVESGVFAHAVECARKKNTDWTATYEFLTEIANDYRCRTVKDLIKWTGWSQSKIKRVLRDSGKTYRDFFFEVLLPNRDNGIPAGRLKLAMNHKVVAIRKLEGTRDTYDLTVDEHHNFALQAGVIVHNSMQDIRFARTIERVQGQVLEGLTKICIVHLMLRGYAIRRATDFQLQSTCPSFAHEKAEQEVETARIGLADQYLNTGMPRSYVWERVLKMTQPEIKKLLRQRRKEDLVLAEREAQVEAYRSKANEYYTNVYAEKFGLDDQEPAFGTGQQPPQQQLQGPENEPGEPGEPGQPKQIPGQQQAGGKPQLPPDASAADKKDQVDADKGWTDKSKTGQKFFAQPTEPYSFTGQRNAPGTAPKPATPKAPSTVISKTTASQSTTRQKEEPEKKVGDKSVGNAQHEDDADEPPIYSDGEPEMIIDRPPDNAKLVQSPKSRLEFARTKRKTKEQVEEEMRRLREEILSDDESDAVLGSDATQNKDDGFHEDTVRRRRGATTDCHVGLWANGELLPLTTPGGLTAISGNGNGNTPSRSVQALKQLQKSQRTEWLLVAGDDGIKGNSNEQPAISD